MSSESGVELRLEADRVSDRLRVLGPRWVERPTAATESALREVRAVLQRLADLAAEVEGRTPRPVPELPPHALADQLLVLVADLPPNPVVILHETTTLVGDPLLEAATALLIHLRHTLP